MPIFFILGKQDDVICNKRVKKVYKYLRSREENLISLKEFENMDHGVFSDGLIYKEVINLVDHWFNKTTPSK